MHGSEIGAVSKGVVFDPFRVPPDLALCVRHRMATQLGVASSSERRICPCCAEAVKIPLGVGVDAIQLKLTSDSLWFYFYLLKMLAVMLIGLFLLTGVFCTVAIVKVCDDESCVKVYGIYVPKPNKYQSQALICLNAIAAFLMYFFLAGVYYVMATQRIEAKTTKHSQQCALICGVDHERVSLSDLSERLSTYHPKRIMYIHAIQHNIELMSHRKQLLARLAHLSKPSERAKATVLQKQVVKIQEKIFHFKNKLTLGQQRDLRTDKVIVKFNDVNCAVQFKEAHRKSLWSNIITAFQSAKDKGVMWVEPLGEPDQMIWQNLHISSARRYARIFVSNLTTLVVLGMSLLGVVYLTHLQHETTQTGNTIMAFVFSGLIELLNMGLHSLIDGLTSWEGRYTLTGQQSAKLIKTSIALFLNTTLVPFSLFALHWLNPDGADLIRNIVTLTFVVSIVSPILGFVLDPERLSRYYHCWQVRRGGYEGLVTQMMANEIFEKPNFNLGKNYANLCQLILNCCFYATVFPFGILFALVGLAITYWLSKVWAIKYSSAPKLSLRLSGNVMHLLGLIPLVYSVGYLINLEMSGGVYSPVPWIMCGVCMAISTGWICFGQRLSRYWATNHHTSPLLTSYLGQTDLTPDYFDLNPTGFLLRGMANTHANYWETLQHYTNIREAQKLRRSSLSVKQFSPKRSL